MLFTETKIIDYYLGQLYHQQLDLLTSNLALQNDDFDDSNDINPPVKPSLTVSDSTKSLLLNRLIALALGDHYIACPSIRYAQDSLPTQRVYQYYWTYKGNPRTSPYWNVFERAWCGPWMGSCHGFEMYALFGVPLANGAVFDHQDRVVSWKTMQMVKYFMENNG